MEEIKKSDAEITKENSRWLRGTILEELEKPSTRFSDGDANLLKFHGSYQEDDRDARKQLKLTEENRRYMFMVRTKVPGGKLSAEQYLALDDLSSRYGNETMRITTRQGIQFHGILKINLKNSIRDINASLITTLGACGDIVRNVLCCPAPLPDREAIGLESLTKDISDGVLPKTRAYHEIWLNDEKIIDSKTLEEEPLFGQTYLPRKFKIGVAYPSDNCIDVYTHDLGFVPEIDGKSGIQGFHVLVGGGLGMTYKRPETHPLLAQPLGFTTPERLKAVIDGVIKVYRDYGNRSNRKRARIKYLVEDKGIDWFKTELKKYTGFDLTPSKTLSWSNTSDHVGWHKSHDGNNFLGVFVENGRIKDDETRRIRAGFRTAVNTFKPVIFLTPQQNIIFSGIPDNKKNAFESLLSDHGIFASPALTETRRWSMACVALPTCNLAITESERVMPSIIDQLEKEMAALNLQDEKITIRMTGCPNGCSRPYNAEIGIVGIGPARYVVYLGGNFEGTRLNQPLKELVKQEELVPTLVPILKLFRDSRQSGERFGDFVVRVGLDHLKTLLPRAKG